MPPAWPEFVAHLRHPLHRRRPTPDRYGGGTMQAAEPTIDVELIFSVSPPVTSRPGRLATSRHRAAVAAVASAVAASGLLALLVVLM
jgi:hypothetical protein